MEDHSTMKVIADQKRRVVLPKPVEPGDVLEITESGDRLVLVRLPGSPALRPPVSPTPLNPSVLAGLDLDEPAFVSLDDGSPS